MRINGEKNILISDTLIRPTKSQETNTMSNAATLTNQSVGSQNHVGSQIGQDDVPSMKIEETSKSEGTQAGGTLQSNQTASSKSTSTGTGTRTKDYNDEMVGCLMFSRYYLYCVFGRMYSLLVNAPSSFSSWN